MGEARFHLICMPFQAAGLSSLSVSLLSTILENNGISAEESYLHFDFAKLVGWDRFRAVADSGAAKGLIGELLFAEDYHGAIADEAVNQTLDECFDNSVKRRELLQTFRNICLQRVEAVGAPLVGFSTSSNQLMPSLWLARQIKSAWPDVTIVFGGSACSLPMGEEVFRQYREVDVIVSGFGEVPILKLATERDSIQRQIIENPARVNLNELPIPDYGSFLEQAQRFSPHTDELMLAFECSRGCWWGEKSHCTFCGLNQLEMAFNSKSSPRVVDEIRLLWDRYQKHMFATDTILSRLHLKQAMPELASYSKKPKLFYEVKANMTYGEIQLLYDANVRWIQPGIESLNTHLLNLMKKGVSAIQNLAILKWCRELRIRVSWNLLCGIPGEDVADYREQMELIPKIMHFRPPGLSPIRVDRFSPYFNSPESFGWERMKPLWHYRYMHPQLDEQALSEIAYHFDAVGGDCHIKDYYYELDSLVSEWKRRYSAGDGLFCDERYGVLRIRDGMPQQLACTEPVARIIDATHEIARLDELLEVSGAESGVVEELIDDGFLYREGNRVLNLLVRVPSFN